MTRRILSNCRAFTLIELIVVTALISIMLVIAIPRLNGGPFSDDSDATVRWIIAHVRHLKEKAVAEQQAYVLNVSPDTQQLWVTVPEMGDAETETAKDGGHTLPRGVRIDSVAYSQTEVYSSGTIPIGFYPGGYSDRAVIRLRTDDGERLEFYIEPFLSGVELVRRD